MFLYFKNEDKVKFSATKYDKDEKKVNLSVDIETVNTDREREHIIHLSSEEDPLFYYTCTIPQNQYSSIRKENDLLVDFDGFPGEFRKIMKRCTLDGGFECVLEMELIQNREKQEDQEEEKFCELEKDPKFPHVDQPDGMRRFIPKVAKLVISQRNEFRKLLHFQAKFYEVDDYTVKQMLLKNIQHLNEELETCKAFPEECKTLRDEKDSIISKIDVMEAEFSEKTNELKELLETKETSLKESSFHIEKLQDKISSFEKILTEERSETKGKLKDYDKKLKQMDTLREEMSEMDKALSVSKVEKKYVQKELSQLEDLKSKLEAKLEKEKEFNSSALAKATSLNQELEKQNLLLKERLEKANGQVEEMEEKVHAVTLENSKILEEKENLNSKIEKLEEENKNTMQQFFDIKKQLDIANGDIRGLRVEARKLDQEKLGLKNTLEDEIETKANMEREIVDMRTRCEELERFKSMSQGFRPYESGRVGFEEGIRGDSFERDFGSERFRKSQRNIHFRGPPPPPPINSSFVPQIRNLDLIRLQDSGSDTMTSVRMKLAPKLNSNIKPYERISKVEERDHHKNLSVSSLPSFGKAKEQSDQDNKKEVEPTDSEVDDSDDGVIDTPPIETSEQELNPRPIRNKENTSPDENERESQWEEPQCVC
ncbi:unnamed protein product [Moneuplotes crassus]|uniref:Spindle assembly abnormal protein 6 N-terminal domain-containing protein n=1 Tax=Euplotes crassus TaxID=5936 RepID=A0AAD1U151_EUPCR|nr:unnamed protein product [Moneuplotes crassus]